MKILVINAFTKLRAKRDCSKALAYVLSPDAEDLDKPDVMQICPWFLDYGMKQSEKFQVKWNKAIIASMITGLKLDKLATWASMTPIDLFRVFDTTIVHELSHTRRAGETDDLAYGKQFTRG